MTILWLTRLITISAVVLAAGCAQQNAGSWDYRLVSHPATGTTSSMKDGDKFIRTTGKDEIKKGEPLQISLETTFLHGFQETRELVGFSRGEIAILADVREYDGTDGLTFSSDAMTKARLVYYSGDVRQHEQDDTGQFLSHGSIPLWGPTTYNGGIVLVRFWIIELDQEESEELKVLLTRLADIGGTAYAPAAPILGVLSELGNGLLSGAQDDVEGEYIAFFYPFIGVDNAHHAYLRSGDVILAKRGNERAGFSPASTADMAPIDWGGLTFDHKTKRLKVGTQAMQDYRGHSYIVLNLTTKVDPAKFDTTNIFMQSLATFREAMRSPDPAERLAWVDALKAKLEAIDPPQN